MGGIILRTSQLEPNVRLSPHSAPDILRQGNYSCILPIPESKAALVLLS
jgi:hypothetical protein